MKAFKQPGDGGGGRGEAVCQENHYVIRGLELSVPPPTPTSWKGERLEVESIASGQ